MFFIIVFHCNTSGRIMPFTVSQTFVFLRMLEYLNFNNRATNIINNKSLPSKEYGADEVLRWRCGIIPARPTVKKGLVLYHAINIILQSYHLNHDSFPSAWLACLTVKETSPGLLPSVVLLTAKAKEYTFLNYF